MMGMEAWVTPIRVCQVPQEASVESLPLKVTGPAVLVSTALSSWTAALAPLGLSGQDRQPCASCGVCS